MVPWINHHGLFTVSELRRIDPGRRELQSTDGSRLFSCFLDFGLQPAMLATALGRPQRPETRSGVVNLNRPEPPAFAPGAGARAFAAAEVAGDTTAGRPTSFAHCGLDTNASASSPAQTPSCQLVVMAPKAPWTLPPELAAPPASPARPYDSSNSSSASWINPLPQTSAPENAAVGGPDGASARTRARTLSGKSPTPSATSP